MSKNQKKQKIWTEIIIGLGRKNITQPGTSTQTPGYRRKNENEYIEWLSQKSDNELIESFNRDVNVASVVSARFRFHDAMKIEFDRRGFDYSDIGNENYMSWARKIKLVGKKIHIIEASKETTKNTGSESS